MRIALLAALVALAGCGDKRDKEHEHKQAAHEKSARGIVKELEKLGFAVDSEHLRIEVKRPVDARSDLDAQQDMFFRPSHFEGMQRLHRMLGLAAAVNGKQFREMAILGIAQTMQAYYQPNRKALVFLENALDKLVYMDALVAHELGHAIQDARPGGLTGLLQQHNATLDGSSVVQCLIEGEAEVISAAVLLARNGRGLDSLNPDDFDHGLERVMAGTTSLVYSVGRRYILGAFADGGWDGVKNAVQHPIASTEQVMHAAKRHDEPTVIELPDPPAESGAKLIHRDVLGELNIYSILLELGVPDGDAYLAAAGWDGDNLRVWDTPGGAPTVAWRIVWDRAVDAEQFEQVFPSIMNLRRTGRTVDLFDGPGAIRRDQVLPPPGAAAENADDARTAAQVESEYGVTLAEGPAVVGDRWVHARHGLSIPIPEGWKTIEFQGVKILATNIKSEFADNITVGAMPNIHGLDLEGFRKENQETITKLDSVKLLKNDKGRIGGRDVLVFEYEGTLPGATQDLHFTGFLYPQGATYLVVTITVLSSRWKEMRETARDVLAGVRLE